MKISVIGTGYVGLVSGACFAELGHEVICVDVNKEKIDQIRKGIPPIHEIGLEDMLRDQVGKNLSASTDLTRAVQESELSIIAVGTPFDGKSIDLSFVKEVAKSLGTVLSRKSDYHTVVVKSTVVPGTTDSVILPILEQASHKRAGADFGVGMNPEFLTEGTAVQDFMNPDRIVLGGIDDRTLESLEGLYRPFVGVPRIRTNCRTAEMIKYAANAMLATQISFINELANLSAELGDIDISDVSAGLRLSSYLSIKDSAGRMNVAPIASFLEAGCGFGGSCLPKDVNALIAHGRLHGLPMDVLSAVITTNNNQPGRLIGIIKSAVGSIKGTRIGILGLAFKPDTDDMRESPAIPIIRSLLEEGADVAAHDPVAIPEARKKFGKQVRFVEDLEALVRSVQVIVLVTRWGVYGSIPKFVSKMKEQPLVVDGRRMFEKDEVARYVGIGFRRN